MTLGLLLLGSCGNNQKVEREQDYIETLRRDYEEIRKENPEVTLKIVTCDFSGRLKSHSDTIRITDYTVTYQDKDGCISITPDDTTKSNIRVRDNLQDIDPEELEMTLAEAVQILRKENRLLPDTQQLEIQKPEGFKHPLYVFGSGYEGYLGVDMIIRKVYKL